MTTIDIDSRRAIVYPVVVGADYQGNVDAESVGVYNIPLTHDYLYQRGGVAYRVGNTWQCRIGLRYLDEDGLVTAVDLTSASSLVMHIYHQLTAEWVAKRTQDASITGALVELAVDAPATDGNITITWHEDETPDSGMHNFAILADWTYGETPAAGVIEIRAALPTES